MVKQVIADRFELVAQAAKGGMGSVYRARDLETQLLVAVKILNLAGNNDRVRFSREASLLSMLEHPHVVRYVAHGVTDEGVHYIVQEWVDGVTLRSFTRTLGTTLLDAITIARGLVEALHAAHALAIVHRDIKPDNVILAQAKTEAVKLVDFGVARTTDTAHKLTRTGTIIGTPSYMSPEQARGETQIGPAADIWAAGCVLYEMLTGRQAFTGKTPMAIRAKVMLAEPPPVAEKCPEASPELVSMVTRMLALAPEDRPPIDEIRGVLHTATHVSGPRRVFDVPGAPVPRKLVGERLSLVLVQGLPSTEDPASRDKQIQNIAQNHELTVHMFEDGSALLESRVGGKEAALAAARAAIALRDQVPDIALSVASHDDTEALDETIERVAASLDRASMETLFGGVVDDVPMGIPIDQTVATLIKDEIDVQGEDGSFRLA